MRRTLIALIAAAVPAIAAAQTIDERQDHMFSRIEEGVRNGALTREEASRLRAEFHDIARLEDRYRYDGLDPYERRELNQRFDELSRRISRERGDTERFAEGVYQRRQTLENNVREGVRGGGLTRQEADMLYAELHAFDERLNILRRSGDGLDQREREELNRRLEQIANRILAERRDGQQGGRNRR